MVRLALSAPPRSLFGARAAVTRATLPRCAVADDDDDDGDELVGGETLNLRGRSVSELFTSDAVLADDDGDELVGGVDELEWAKLSENLSAPKNFAEDDDEGWDAAAREGIYPLDDPTSAARGLAQIATDAAEEIAEAADRNAVVIDTDAWEALQRLMRPNETDPFFQQKAEFIAAMRREHSEFWHSAQLEYFDEGFTVESPLGTARRETIAYSNSSDLFGEKLLRDATIRVTAVTEPTRDTVCLHWSLAFVAAVLPWAPRCEWTGVSRWTLDYPSARALKQEDFWDSVDLRRGKYRRSARSLAWADVRGQLAPRRLFKSDVPELRYELLRRARGYELRRYEAHVAASVPFELWPVGVSALKRYVDGRNEEGRAVRKSLPMLVSLPERGEEEAGDDAKRMACPLIPLETSAAAPSEGGFPAPISQDGVALKPVPAQLFAVARLKEDWADERARARALELAALAEADGLEIASAAAPIVAQYRVDSLFAFQPRGNELWLPVVGDPYDF